MPLLEIDDVKLNERARDLLMGADLRPEDSFSVLARYLASHKNVPDSFIEVMFRLSPGEALRAVGGEYLSERERWRRLIWTDHVVSDAVWKKENQFLKAEDTANALALLRDLAGWDEWWARLYVAETISRHSFLRNDEIINRVKKDQHPAIARVLARR